MWKMQVGEVGADWFSIYLIPETLRVTVLGAKKEGDTVNVEIEAQTQVCLFCSALGNAALAMLQMQDLLLSHFVSMLFHYDAKYHLTCICYCLIARAHSQHTFCLACRQLWTLLRRLSSNTCNRRHLHNIRLHMFNLT